MKTLLKILGVVFAILLIFSGVICGISLYKELTASSYINGSLDVENLFSQEKFNYSASSLELYHDVYDETYTYTFKEDQLKVENFDGKKYEYVVLLNDYELNQVEVGSGYINASLPMNFYKADGTILSSPVINISITFLSNKTPLEISVIGSQEAELVMQYFDDYGIRLEVIERLEYENKI